MIDIYVLYGKRGMGTHASTWWHARILLAFFALKGMFALDGYKKKGLAVVLLVVT